MSMALSESFGKFFEKIGENVTRYTEKENTEKFNLPRTQRNRSGSPFLLLLSEGDQEYNLNKGFDDALEISAHDTEHLFEEKSLNNAIMISIETITNKPSTLNHTETEINASPPKKQEHSNTIEVEKVYFECSNMNHSKICRDDSNHPLMADEFKSFFDHSGRLINEHEFRRVIFKGGTAENIRKDVWQFLFELYPFNTTVQEREILKVEQKVKYEAMKIRWKKLLKNLVNEYEGVAYCPKWFTGCTKFMKTGNADSMNDFPRHKPSMYDSLPVKHDIDSENTMDSLTEVLVSSREGKSNFFDIGEDIPKGMMYKDDDHIRSGRLLQASGKEDLVNNDANSPDKYYLHPSISKECLYKPFIRDLEYLDTGAISQCPSQPNDVITHSHNFRSKTLPLADNFSAKSKQELHKQQVIDPVKSLLEETDVIAFQSSCSVVINGNSDSSPSKKGIKETLECDCYSVEGQVTLNTDSLRNLPPWLAQVMNASTPGSQRSGCKCIHRKRNELSSYSCDEFLQEMDDDIIQRRELRNIIENANRYLREKTKSAEINMVEKSHQTDEEFIHIFRTAETKSGKNSMFTHTENENEDVTLENTIISFDPWKNCKVQLLSPSKSYVEVVRNNDSYSYTNNSCLACPYCNFDPDECSKIILPSSLGEEQLKFMQIQAQVYAARQPYDSNVVSESVRVIDKDVPRTDRDLAMFKGNDNIGLIKLRDALLTYAFFNPDVGYAQGMNDIMARFLVVTGIEYEAYWMFVRYMEHFKHHFMEEGMLQNISFVEQLLIKMDRELYEYLQNMDMGLMFCHRWLLLSFKREFEYFDAIRIFEITSSRHLEVFSLEAEMERSRQRAVQFVKDSAGSHLEEIYMSPEIPFDIFVCVAMLMECKEGLMSTGDISAIYEILTNLPSALDLEIILKKSEELFYNYCRKTVFDCFQVIDEIEVTGEMANV